MRRNARAAATWRGIGAACALIALATAVTRCGYAPNFASGTLLCSTSHTCPEGYVCASDNKCWKKGEAPSGQGGSDGGSDARIGDGGGGTDGRGGATGTGGATSVDGGRPTDKFIGRWVFDATSQLQQVCSDGTNNTSSLATDYVDVTAGTTSDLVGSYFCDWKLNLSATDKTLAAIVAGQSCMTKDATMTIDFTVHGGTFDFRTTNGTTATLSAMFPAEFKKAAGPTGTCQFTITGKLVYMP
jgi:hypothetical protein